VAPAHGAWIVARREIRDHFRDWRILAPILLLTVFFPALMNFTARSAVDFVTRYGAPIIAERLIPFLLMVVGFFPISISLVIALESFAGERERLSLEPLLATPLSDAQLYLGKMLASLVPPLAAAYLGISVYLAGLWLSLRWSPPPILLAQILLLTTVQAVVMVTGAVVVSSQTTSVRAANLLASFIIIPVSQLIIGESLVMFWGRYQVLWWILAGLAVLAAVLTRMGLALFNREQLLGREIDVLSLRWVLSRFWSSFRGPARTPVAWYADVFRRTLPRLRASILLICGFLIAGFLLGQAKASEFPLPREAFETGRMAEALETIAPELSLSGGQAWGWVLGNNLRALLLASVLGAFTFGVLAVILLMAPVGLVGYFMGNAVLAGQNGMLLLTALVLPHGVLEVPAAVLAGAAIIQLGLAGVSMPPGGSLGESLLDALANWTRVGIGLVVPLLILAAAVEVFVTPRVAVMLLSGG
jgi:uncharacterized membrane protein SpoIIM required for sporulation